MSSKIKVIVLPDFITMKEIEYDWLGRVKKIVFRDAEEMKALRGFYPNGGTPVSTIEQK